MLLKNSISTLSLLILFTISLFAQDGPDRMKRQKARIDIKAQLDLSEEQEVKMKDVHEVNKLAIKAIIKDENLDKDQKKAAIKMENEKMNSQMAQFLSSEQMSKLNEIQSLRKEMRIRKMRAFGERKKERKAEMKERKEKMKAMKEKRVAAKEYREKNIEPVLLKQRMKFEEDLSEEDKQKIQQLRQTREEAKSKRKVMKEERKEKMKAKKEAMKEKRKEMKERDNEKRKIDKEKLKEKFKAHKKEREEKIKLFKEEHREDIEAVEFLLDKYENEIEDLMKEIEDEKNNWEQDLSNIMGKGNDKNRRFNGKKENGHNKKGDSQETRSFNRGLVHFLLLDPNASVGVTKKSIQRNIVSEFSVFPNPAKDFNTLKFNLEQSGNVQVGLYEESGKLVKTILNEFAEAGEYELNVNIQDLRPSYYIYTIKTEQGVKSQKILVSE